MIATRTPPIKRRRERPLWTAACRMHDRLREDHDWLRESELPILAWSECQRRFDRIRKALSHRWEGAVRASRRETRDALSQLLAGIENARTAIDPDRNAPLIMSAAEIYGDLVALHDEFPEVRCDLGRRHLSAVTEPIVLEEVYLGAFEIRLDWGQQPFDYDVIACDPQPPVCSGNVTHPHVECERLCAGEGRSAIQNSLRQGRVADFFLIVRQILKTYNDSSAYVALKHWHRRGCPGCGDALDDEECSECDECGSDFCHACVSDCAGCGSFGCDDCHVKCPACEDFVCRHCLTKCDRCREPLCERCRNAKTCRHCKAREEEQPRALPALHTAGVGETAVSA
ncbi:MAG: hypothetical protein CMJ48_08075 [Planctomycetaceae bacterium]|nr:hypothetical protein [Planctomycetaceae bacterium]